MKLTRRHFLGGMGALAAQMQMASIARAVSTDASLSDYKALVCLFLYGGNDSNNMIIPTDTTGYANYAAVRGNYTTNSAQIGIPQASLIPLVPTSGTGSFGLHPNLAPLQSVWNSGNLAMLFNTGTLVKPITKADYASLQNRPTNLYSHSDQQHQWQTAIYQGDARTGWAGRLADGMSSVNSNTSVPMVVAASNSDLFGIGDSTAPLTIPSSPTAFGLNSYGGTYASAVSTAVASMNDMHHLNRLGAATTSVFSSAVESSSVLSPVLTAATSIDTYFSSLKTGIANQLWDIAKIVAQRTSLGDIKREVFFVSLGGFDTHVSEISNHVTLYNQLSAAMVAFNNAMISLGTNNAVTTFTMSDFNRTFKINGTAGTDHAWGGHHMIMGGAVKGATFYGTFPSLVLGGADDVYTDGRWLPTTSVDQYGATLCKWFGVSTDEMARIFPNLANFPATDLGFLA